MASPAPLSGPASRIALALLIGVAGAAQVCIAAYTLATLYNTTGNCLLAPGLACRAAMGVFAVLYVGFAVVPVLLAVALSVFAFAMLSRPRRPGERPGSVTLCAVLMGAAFVQAAVALAIQPSPSALRLGSASAFLLGYGFAAVGLWRMWPAGLRIAIAVGGLSIAVSAYSLVMAGAFWPVHVARIVLMGLALSCLLHSVTREAFEPS